MPFCKFLLTLLCASLCVQQAAIMAVKSTDSLAVIEKLVYNVVVAPRDEKFRRVKLSNPKINAAIVQARHRACPVCCHCCRPLACRMHSPKRSAPAVAHAAVALPQPCSAR